MDIKTKSEGVSIPSAAAGLPAVPLTNDMDDACKQQPQSAAPPEQQQHHLPALPTDNPTSLFVNTQPREPPGCGMTSPSPEPPLARRSAPLTGLPNAPPPTPLNLPTRTSDTHLAPGGCSSSSSSTGGSGSGPAASISARSLRGDSASSELSRRLRSLLAAAVTFRDVELTPRHPSLEAGGDLDLLQQQDEPDADAATGAAPPPPPAVAAATAADADVLSYEDRSSSGGFGTAGGDSGAAGEPGGEVERKSTGGSSVGAVGSGSEGGVAGGGRVGSVSTRAVVRKNKLVIIMVGLPGRGKTFLCNKICAYLSWLGHVTRHFNVGQYRRRQRGDHHVVQDAEFFDHANEAGVEARNRALNAALDDLMNWLRGDENQVAVFDATNTTQARRNLLRSKFHGVWQYLFIETICSDPAVLEQNYHNKMGFSSDYDGVDKAQAVADFLARIAKYEAVYEPISDRSMHYIKLIDMVTGRGHMDINRISGYLPGKIVFFLMQVCKAGMTSARKIWFTRHGESQYNEKGLIGGNSSLSKRGECYARALPAELEKRIEALQAEGQGQPLSVAVWTSTLKRTIETARRLPYAKVQWKALDEINAGICDGMTYKQIEVQYPEEYKARGKDKLCYRYPAGESYMDVIQRVEPVITELERERNCVVVVAHQAVLRALYGYFMNVPNKDIPRLSMPLHTLIELTPLPNGTMSAAFFPADIPAAAAPPPTCLPLLQPVRELSPPQQPAVGCADVQGEATMGAVSGSAAAVCEGGAAVCKDVAAMQEAASSDSETSISSRAASVEMGSVLMPSPPAGPGLEDADSAATC
ncbi:hypothetical protein Agub_g14563 [Astrephomene gubernaculifera]|uniref:6-phosphofructo-2-kinase domain-containing protein n=1 Tax=Astrephomene gubernaculifera TaxID=47775 RepID=A0AAD3E3P9_9CHLO|nr:hypothetical protein Agub_g14563 [Astrephomene gubernaculifera]